MNQNGCEAPKKKGSKWRTAASQPLAVDSSKGPLTCNGLVKGGAPADVCYICFHRSRSSEKKTKQVILPLFCLLSSKPLVVFLPNCVFAGLFPFRCCPLCVAPRAAGAGWFCACCIALLRRYYSIISPRQTVILALPSARKILPDLFLRWLHGSSPVVQVLFVCPATNDVSWQWRSSVFSWQTVVFKVRARLRKINGLFVSPLLLKGRKYWR